MTAEKVRTVREVMTDVFAFPHIPYWFTLRQAVGILKNSLLKEEGVVQPSVVLVFDERYNLVGTLTLEDLLRGMRPLFDTAAGAAGEAGAADWSAVQVGALMTRVPGFVEPDVSCAEAARAMAAAGAALLPVLEERRKLVGIVRTRDLFREFAARL